MAIKKKKLVLFDLDGVLIDSKSNMCRTWELVSAEFGLAVPFENYFSNIGRPFRDILSIIGVTERQPDIEMRYNEVSSENIAQIEIFPGAQEFLHFLEENDILIGIVTSKEKKRVQKILQRFENRFSVIRTPDGICRGKPAPDHLLMAVALENVDPSETLFVGDMDVDSIAAKRAGVDYVHASWGYGSCGERDYQLQEFSDMDQYIFGDAE
ncbi:HAD family hydrolase [Candidatus Puniceispirillum sp.]|nr:HAD family hydrolase [Candidatus Puniceispirillum sp.]